MHVTISLVIILSSFVCNGQSHRASKFPVKTTFQLGEIKTYHVSEFYKIDELFFGDRYEVESTIKFHVIDSGSAGYRIKYSVNSTSAKQRKDSTAYYIAALQDGITLDLYAKSGTIQIDLAIYFATKDRIAAKLDSMTLQKSFGKNNNQFIQYLKTKLKKDAGLGYLLSPLMLFSDYYTSEEFKQFPTSYKINAGDILNKPLFSGSIAKEWERTLKDSTVKLNSVFVGHPVAAALYHKSIYEPLLAENNVKMGRHFFPPEMRYLSDYTFIIRPGNSFPSFLYKKNVSEYIFRSVLKLEMREL